MKCKKCGRPMGKGGRCTYCDRQKAQHKKNKKFLFIGIGIAAAVLILALVLCLTLGGDEDKTDTVTGKTKVAIEVQDFGTIVVELDPEAAPISVENFLELVDEGFYDGLTFHRIWNGFMMQGGAPNADSRPVAEIKGEFSANGVNNPLSHTRGAISMARTDVNDSATSQFFIVHEDSPHLDGQYACFGYVIEGMEVVDAICEYALTVETNDNRILLNAEDQPIITSIKVLE